MTGTHRPPFPSTGASRRPVLRAPDTPTGEGGIETPRDDPTPSTSTSPTTRHLWTRSRGLIAAFVALLLFGIVYALVRSGENHGRLDPRSPDRFGSRAGAQLLAQRGVDVDVVTTAADAAARTGPDTTLLIAFPDLLTPEQLTVIRDATSDSPGSTVLLSPTPSSLATLAPDARAVSAAEVQPVDPECDLPAARRAGTVDLGGVLYESSRPSADSCYLVDGYASLLRLSSDGAGGGDTVVLGAPDALYNHRLDDQGNASLALQLLGRHPELVWYLPSAADDSVAGEQRGFMDLIPDGWRWGALQLAIAAAVTALWRARRLGPVVPESLPVAVRATETTEGRARLYRKANARARAADALRQATRARLAPLVGVPPAPAQDAEAFSTAVAAHADSSAAEVRSLLYGAAPADDTALLRLADELDALTADVHDWQVRTS